MNSIAIPSIRDNLMWDLWMSMYHTSIISLCIKLGVFECLKSVDLNIEEMANVLNTNPRSIGILIHPLVGLGLLIKNNEKYSLTPTAQTYLLSSSHFYWGPIFEGLEDRIEYKRLFEAIKTDVNQLAYGNKTFTEMWKEGSLTPDAAQSFTKKMHATIFAPALHAIKSGIFKSTKKLLDVGTGSGCFSIAYLLKYPKYKATLFDLPAVCDVTRQYVNQFNLIQNVNIHAGNFFIKDDWPTDCEGVLLSQILHDWPIEQCETILNYAYEVLPNNGSIYIHEMLLSDDKNKPLTTACFDLVMYINHNSQQFTKNELYDLLGSAGFNNFKIKKTFGYYSVISAKK